MGKYDGIPLSEFGLAARIKTEIGYLFFLVATKLLPKPFWDEFAIQWYADLKGGRLKEEANRRHEKLTTRLQEYQAGRGSGEWPPNDPPERS